MKRKRFKIRKKKKEIYKKNVRKFLSSSSGRYIRSYMDKNVTTADRKQTQEQNQHVHISEFASHLSPLKSCIFYVLGLFSLFTSNQLVFRILWPRI